VPSGTFIGKVIVVFYLIIDFRNNKLVEAFSREELEINEAEAVMRGTLSSNKLREVCQEFDYFLSSPEFCLYRDMSCQDHLEMWHIQLDFHFNNSIDIVEVTMEGLNTVSEIHNLWETNRPEVWKHLEQHGVAI